MFTTYRSEICAVGSLILALVIAALMLALLGYTDYNLVWLVASSSAAGLFALGEAAASLGWSVLVPVVRFYADWAVLIAALCLGAVGFIEVGPRRTENFAHPLCGLAVQFAVINLLISVIWAAMKEADAGRVLAIDLFSLFATAMGVSFLGMLLGAVLGQAYKCADDAGWL